MMVLMASRYFFSVSNNTPNIAGYTFIPAANANAMRPISRNTLFELSYHDKNANTNIGQSIIALPLSIPVKKP